MAATPTHPPRERRQLDPRLDMERLPRHIAIIMDGNGRWAELHGKAHVQGHEAGARGVRQAIEGCRELGVECLTLYAFSTENWKRSELEVNALFTLMSKYIYQEIDEIAGNGIRVRVMGRQEKLSERSRKDLAYCVERTQGNTAMTCCVGINYGGRQEIVDATRALAEAAKAGGIDPAAIDETALAQHLYVPEYPEVDLLIRTSGEMRVSNFMLWQISYAEIVVTQTLWPDFDKQQLCECILEYQGRSRRFGGRK